MPITNQQLRQQLLDLLRPLHMAVVRVELKFQEPIELPGQYAQTLRGGIGVVFKRLVCVQPKIEYCRDCVLVNTCAFPAVFETPIPAELENLPHLQEASPYIIRTGRAAQPTGARSAPVEAASFQIVLFGKAIGFLPYFVIAIRQMGERHGFGQRRTRFLLHRVIDETPGFAPRLIYQADRNEVNLQTRQTTLERLVQSLPPPDEPVDVVNVTLTTPLRLKVAGKISAQPTFANFTAALLRRLSQLIAVHEQSQIQLDEVAILAAAQAVELADHSLETAAWSRFSSRQQQRIWMGGIVGELVYRGELSPFLPLLWAGQFVHLGKGTVFGNGQYTVYLGG